MFQSKPVVLAMLLSLLGALAPFASAREDGPALPKAPVTAERSWSPGLWSQLTTLALIRGRWLDEKQFQRFQETDNPDLFLAAFPAAEAHQLAALALDIGFPALREARDRPSQGVAVADRSVELLCHIQKTTSRGKLYYQPIIQVRLTRIQPPAAGGNLAPGQPRPVGF